MQYSNYEKCKIDISINPERIGANEQIKIGNLEPRNFLEYQSILNSADKFDSTNVNGMLHLNYENFYKSQKYFKDRNLMVQSGQLEEDQDFKKFAYAHQIQTVETILKLEHGGLLADQVGMGKTIEAGMIIAELAHRDEWRTLLITLSNDDLINNWVTEMKTKFGLNLAILKTGKTEDELTQSDIEKIFNKVKKYQQTAVAEDMEGKSYDSRGRLLYQGIIVPFAYLVDKHFTDLIDKYNEENSKKFDIDLIVVDESHKYTINDSSSNKNKINCITKLQNRTSDIQNKDNRVLLLTATPIKSDLSELLELVQIIDESYTKEKFMEELGLDDPDNLSLTEVLSAKNGVNKWWDWFSKYGERHTRKTTNYDPEKRRNGVHWKKKNSHTYYFYDSNKFSSVNNYFIDIDDETVIKTVTGKIVNRPTKEYSKLKGKRESFNIEYESYPSSFIYANSQKKFDGFRFERVIKIIKYLKKDPKVPNLDWLNKEDDEFDFKTLKNALLTYNGPKPPFGTINSENLPLVDKKFLDNKYDIYYWNEFTTKDSYDDLGIHPLEAWKKTIIESVVTRFIQMMNYKCNGKANYPEFINTLTKYIKSVNPRINTSFEVTLENLALILCTDDFFLELQKMSMLGNIIATGSDYKMEYDNGFFTLIAGERPDFGYAGVTNYVRIIDEPESKEKAFKCAKTMNVHYVSSSLSKTGRVDESTYAIKFELNESASIRIDASSPKSECMLVIRKLKDNYSTELIHKESCPKRKEINISLDKGTYFVGFERTDGKNNSEGYIYYIHAQIGDDLHKLDMSRVNFKDHSNEKIIIFCKDDSEVRMLKQNSGLWDYLSRLDKETSASSVGSVGNQFNNNLVTVAFSEEQEGLNLQAYHTMINYTIVLSPLRMEQRIGRIDRIGQKYDMDIYFLANSLSLDGYIQRFFEYELELFSNYTGDTTASTYIEKRYGDRVEATDFEEACKESWNHAFNVNSISDEEKYRNFEDDVSSKFNDVRTKTRNLLENNNTIDDMTEIKNELSQEAMDIYDEE